MCAVTRCGHWREAAAARGGMYARAAAAQQTAAGCTKMGEETSAEPSVVQCSCVLCSRGEAAPI